MRRTSGTGAAGTEGTVTVTVPLAIKRRGGRKLVLAPDGSASPAAPARGIGEVSQELRLLARAFRWRRMLESGGYGSISELAAAEGINPSYVGRMLRLTLLETDAIRSGM